MARTETITVVSTDLVSLGDRSECDELLASSPVQSTQPAQLRHCVALHAQAAKNTYPLVLGGDPQAATWD